jgi:two-component system nitrogen regulation sensor histidine kinase GlnL
MSSAPEKCTNHKAAGRGPEHGSSLEGLAGAISALQGACNRLAGSFQGVNKDLEAANLGLADALKVRTETAAYLEDVLADIPSGVIVVDREGNVALFNRAAEAITGFTAPEVNGRRYSETLGRGVSRRQTPLYTLATGCRLSQEEKTVIAKSGEHVPVSSSTSLIGGRNAMAGAIEVIADLRRLKALEAEVDRVRTLAAIGELAAVVAHEIRNPLGGIKGFTSLLERDLASDPEGLALVGRIREGIESLEGIVNDLLEAGSSIKLRFADTELTAETLRVVEICRMAAEGEGKHIDFGLQLPDPPLYCRVDAGRIRQALNNLIRNAVEAVGDTGRVTVRVRVGSAPGRRSGNENDPRDYIYIEVTDTGPGIPADEADKIFTPFFTTKHGGTGLGLPTVRRIAGLHGGEVGYSSPAAGGSTFTMTIPRW